MKLKLYALLAFTLLPILSIAQIYSTTKSGIWTDLTLWRVSYDEGITWEAATRTPTNSDSYIIIGNVETLEGHKITVPQSSSANINEVIVQAGSELIVAPGATINLFADPFVVLSIDPAGKVLVQGTIQANRGAKIDPSSAANLIIDNNGIFRYNQTNSIFGNVPGEIPLAVWNVGSTLQISAHPNIQAPPSYLNQNFYNVVWNTSTLAATVDLRGTLQNVRNNLEFINTGTGAVSLSETPTENFSLNVGNNFLIGSGANVFLSNKQSNPSITVNGNFVLSGKSVVFTDGAALSVSVLGNMTVNGSGTYDLVKILTNGTGVGNTTVSVAGNTYIHNGTITKSSASGTGTLNTNSVTLETADAGGTVVSNISLNVSGNWTATSRSRFNGSAASFNFNGSMAQSIASGSHPFGPVTFSNTGTKTLVDNMNVRGHLTLTADAGTNTLLNLNGQQLSVGGNWINQGANLSTAGSTVVLDGATQSITAAGRPFGSLHVINTGTKLLMDPLDVDGNLSIGTGATLDMNTTTTLHVGGNLAVGGTYTGGSTATLNLDGGAAQSLSGATTTTFNNINVVNVTGISSDLSINLLGTLTLADGATFDTDGAGNGAIFTLVSGAAQTASIAPLLNGAAVTGAVNVQRFIPAAGNISRYVATPVVGASVADWQNDVPVYLATSSTPNLYYYNEATPGLVDFGWVAYPNAFTEALGIGRGYALQVVNGASAQMLQVRGTVKQGEAIMPVSFTGSADGDDFLDDGWNLLGNPYPSTINWASVWSRATNVEPTVWVTTTGTSADGTLVYASYNANGGGSLAGGSENIASGQAFWVKAERENPALTVLESDKSNVNTATFFRVKTPENVLVVALRNDKMLDETAIIYKDGMQGGYDTSYDTYKLKNYGFSLSSLGSNGEDLAYNFQPWFSCSSEVSLLLDYTEPGNYQMSFRSLETFKRQVNFTLLDQLTGTTTPVSASSTYNFSISEDPKSFGKERFKIVAAYEQPKLDLALSAQAACVGTPASVAVATSESGVLYQAFLGDKAVSDAVSGNGSDLQLPLYTAALTTGEHTIVVKTGRSGCSMLPLTQTARLSIYNTFQVSSTTAGLSCGGGTVTLKAEGAPEGGLYRWYATADATQTLQESSNASFTTPALSQSTWYYVAVSNANGCEGQRVKVQAEVAATETPVISEQEGIFSTSGMGTYQWYLNDLPIAGATEASFTPVQSGAYVVTLTNAKGCVSSSSPVQFEAVALGLEDLNKGSIAVWPNPSTGNLQIKASAMHAGKISISIIALDGKRVLQPQVHANNSEAVSVDISSLRAGMYILEISDGVNTVRSTIVKK